MQEEQCKTSPKTSNRQIHIFSMKKFCCESSFDEQLTKIHGEDFNSLQLFLILGKGNEMLLKTKPKQAFRKIYTCISRATFDTKIISLCDLTKIHSEDCKQLLIQKLKKMKNGYSLLTIFKVKENFNELHMSSNNIGVQTSMKTFKLRKIYTFTSRAMVVQIMLMKNIYKDSQAKLTNRFNFHNIISKTNETECFWEKLQSSWFGNKRCFFTVTCLCSIYSGFYNVNMAGTTRDKIKLREHVKLFRAFVNWKKVLEKRKQNWQIFGLKKTFFN